MTAVTNEIKDANGYLGYSLLTIAFLTLLLLFSLCGICRSKDRCFQKSRLEDNQQELVEDNPSKDISSAEVPPNAGTGSASQIEMPDRAKRY